MESNAKLLRDILFCLGARAALRPLCLLPVKQNRVLFLSYRGKQYSCNPRAISEALQKMADGKLEIAWAFHEPEKFKYLEARGVKVLGDTSREFFLYALTARVVCTNTYYKPFLPRRRAQFYLRTWHGGGAYKKVGKDERLPFLKRVYVGMQQQGANLYLSSSRAFTRLTLREAFGYKGDVLECGMPRNDMLLSPDPSALLRVRDALGLKDGEKLALYAPTFRDDAHTNAFALDFARAKEALEARFGGKFVLAYRGHHVVAAEKTRARVGETDCTDYPDMQELLLAADALITDYSSCIWDMSLTGKPVFLYATDLREYRAGRDFYTDIHTWPFPLAENNDELEARIRAFDEGAYREAVKKHHEELGSFETGRASAEAAKRILRTCHNRKSMT